MLLVDDVNIDKPHNGFTRTPGCSVRKAATVMFVAMRACSCYVRSMTWLSVVVCFLKLAGATCQEHTTHWMHTQLYTRSETTNTGHISVSATGSIVDAKSNHEVVE